MPTSKIETRRQVEPRIRPLHAAVASAAFGFALAIISLQIMLSLLHTGVSADLRALAQGLNGDPIPARAPDSVLNIARSRMDLPLSKAEDCAAGIAGWLGTASQGIAGGVNEAMASTICGGVHFAVSPPDADGGFTIVRAAKADDGRTSVEAVIVSQATLNSLDVLRSNTLMLALASAIALSAGIFGYFLRRVQYLAYVDVRDRAFTDELSGVLRREQFMTSVQQTTANLRDQGGTASLLAIDLDHFKSINDSFGHAAGDEVIRRCGRLLSSAVRDGDIVGRVGGEEFMILLPNLPKYIAAEVADRLRKQMAAHAYCFDGRDLFVTMSTGVASLMSSDDIASLMDRADRRLYMAKAHGRNGVVWEDDDNHDF